MIDPSFQVPPPKAKQIQFRWTWIGGLLAIAVVMVIGISAGLLHRQLFLFDESRQAQPERLAIWDISQLQRQLLTLRNAVEVALVSQGAPDRTNLQLQLDLAFSRIEILSHGDVARAVSKLPQEINRLPSIRTLLEEIERDYPSFLAQPGSTGPAIRKRLIRAILISQESHSLAWNNLLFWNERLGTRLDAVESQTLILDAVFVVLVMLLMVVIWRTFRSRLHTVYNLVEQLQHSEERFRHLVEVSIQGLVVHRNFDVVYANDAFLNMLGIADRSDSLSQNDLLAEVVPHLREKNRGNETGRRQGDPVEGRYEIEVHRKDRKSLWVEVQARSINWDGEPAGLLTVVDLTDRILAEESLKRAKETSDAVSVAKSSFLANMSHELRTPMTSVIGFADLILKGIYGKVPVDIEEAVEEIQTSGRQLLGLINDVLDISKIESGHLKLRISENSPMDSMISVVRRMKSLADEKGIELEVDHQGTHPDIARFDSRRIVQVLMNLIGNAIKFTDHGTIHVGMNFENDVLTFWVTDPGIGIPPESMGNLFDEFHQVSGERSQEGSGAGLGLAIVKGIVEGHGGKVWVESRVELGSTFWFSLPQRRAVS